MTGLHQFLGFPVNRFLLSTGLVPAANMRPPTVRGLVQPNTSYVPWDLVTYKGRSILITSAVTTGAATDPDEPFISATKYMPWGQTGFLESYAPGYDVRGDGSTDCTTRLQKAIDHCSAMGGGTVLLPPGIILVSNTIVLKDNVWLFGMGHGPGVTEIKLANGSNCHTIRNYTWTGSGAHNAQYCGLMNMRVNGNKDNQSGGGPYYGVYLATNPNSTAGGSGDPQFDPSHILMNLTIYKAYSDGLRMEGRSDVRVTNVKVAFAGRYGIYSSFDSFFDGCVVEKSAKAAYVFPGTSTRAVNCKAYLAGEGGGTPNEGYGFWIPGYDPGPTEIALVACDAQQVYAHAFKLDGNCHATTLTGCTAQEVGYNNNGAGPWAAFALDAGGNHIISGTSVATATGNGSALLLTGGTAGNSIDVTHTTISSGTAAAVAAGSSLLGNRVVINGANQAPVGGYGLWTPADHGLLTWSMPDPSTTAPSSTAPTPAGTLHFARVHLPMAATVTYIEMYAVLAGSGLTSGQCFAALYTSAGVLVAQTVDQAAAWATAGRKQMQLASGPYSLAAADYYITFWYNGTTSPAWARSANSAAGLANWGLSAPNLRFGTTNDTGKTTLAPTPLGTQTAGQITWAVALS